VRLGLLAAASAGLCFAWQRLWFLTDDAFIAFRYVANRQLGHGYVWNAPPFLPVEGYTSFLWVALLDGVWSVLGSEPPDAANALGLLCGIGTLALTAWMVLRLRLPASQEPLRTAFLAIALIGLVTNFNFVMWTSSGLETSLFNFLFAGWVAATVFIAPERRGWVWWSALTAGLLSLTRPDGLLVVAATGALLGAMRIADPGRLPLRNLRLAWPLLLPVAHTLWRHSFYGEWLPNTYWAKHVAPWPEAGLRYLASYTLEYGLWAWATIVSLALALRLRGLRPRAGTLPALAVATTLLAHTAYYVLRVGGDHFEYRVFSHSVALVLVSSVWGAARLAENAQRARPALLALPGLVVALAIPLPWTLWVQSRSADTRQTSFNLTVPLAPLLPSWLASYAGRLDALQRWLIVDHAIGKRYQEHRVFLDFRKAMFPRERQLQTDWPEHSAYTAISVGIPGWILADAHILDRVGLNDYVVARTPVRDVESRRMAHDRRPPDGYIACFHPNISDGKPRSLLRNAPLAELREHAGEVRVQPRISPLSADDIRRCEGIWRLWLKQPQ
jgi:arabinofuranosyltransferase